MLFLLYIGLITLSNCIIPTRGQSSSSCVTSVTPTNSIEPSIASGYRAALVATGLTDPRSIQFDTSGNLLVVQAGKGVISLQLQDNGGTCVSVKSQRSLVEANALTHGLSLSQDGRTLYASSSEAVYSWDYDPAVPKSGDTNKTIVTGMSTNDHTTRTLLMSQKVNSTLLVSKGSTSNVDLLAEVVSSGDSQIKAFDLSNSTSGAYNFSNDGLRLGWGLRNSVGVAEHPETGGIYSVENSVDDIVRDGQDIHEDNPGEEMNFHGYLNGTKYAPQGSNYGYPYCFAAWDVGDIPMNSNLTIGSQFAVGDQNSTNNDTSCAERTAPRLTFQAHMAPLDIKFNASGTEAWVTFHGSWDRTNPVGYKLSVIPFANGEPVALANNNTATTDVFTNANNSVCPEKFFRPVGIAFDSQGRLFMSSDASGKIYIITKDETSNVTNVGSSSSNGRSTSGARIQTVAHLFDSLVLTILVVLVLT